MPIRTVMSPSLFRSRVLVACLLTFTLADAAPDREPDAVKATVTESWRQAYQNLHGEVVKLEEKVRRHYYPEFMIIKGSHTIATVQVDAFGAKVLREADELLLPYREGLLACVNKYRNEYRQGGTYSFERFSWFLDAYVGLLAGTIGEHAEPRPVNGVREKRVTTDRTLYAYTQLAVAYLREKADRHKALGLDDSAAEKALAAAVQDVGRRVFRLDLNQKFDYRELIEKGPESQPVFRSLATEEGRVGLDAGLEPLAALMKADSEEPPCTVAHSGARRNP